MRSRSSRTLRARTRVVQTMVLDCDTGRQGQGLGQCFVLVTESLGTDLVGEIEVAEDLLSNPQRHAQEGGSSTDGSEETRSYRDVH